MPDLAKRATDIACSYFSDLLIPSAHITVTRRTAALARLLEAIEPLLSLHVFETIVVPPYLCRLLAQRLHVGPHPSWDGVDERLSKLLDTVPMGTRLGMENAWFQEVLESRTWEDARAGRLRVRPVDNCLGCSG